MAAVTSCENALSRPLSLEIFPNSACSHWLLRGYMTSNNKTVSRQNLSASNIEKSTATCKRTQHSRAKSLTDFKLCATTPNNAQQHDDRVCKRTFSSPEPLGLICNRPVTPRFPTTWPRNGGLWGREWQTDATCNIQQCCVHLHGSNSALLPANVDRRLPLQQGLMNFQLQNFQL